MLAIESTCDETAAAIVRLEGGTVSVLSSVVSSQVELHAKYGGVVPNLAAREHVAHIIPVIEETLARAQITKDTIDAIAVTQGPGLIPALLIGVSAAKMLAAIWKKPLLGIHHIEGHIYANFIGKPLDPIHAFPLLALVVSGGHTQLLLMKDHFTYEILGETRDDAAGEAFDKVARILGLPYPGGPAIAKRAENHTRNTDKLPSYVLPRPMIDSPDFDFSFSGLKTAVLYLSKATPDLQKNESFIDAVSHEFQEAVVDVLLAKTGKAIEAYAPKTVIIAGGVSANVRLRERMDSLIADQFPHTRFIMPEFQYSLDNAAMIGSAALFRYAGMTEKGRENSKKSALSIHPDANLAL